MQEWGRPRPTTGKGPHHQGSSSSGSQLAAPGSTQTSGTPPGGRQAGSGGQGGFNAAVTRRLRDLQKDQMDTVQQETRPRDVRLTGKTVLAVVLAAGALPVNDNADLDSD